MLGSAKDDDFLGLEPVCRPAFRGGFCCFRVLGVAASRKWSRARSGFRAQREFAPGFRGEQPKRHRFI